MVAEMDRVLDRMTAGLVSYMESVRSLIAHDELPSSPERAFDESLFYHLFQNVLRLKAAGITVSGVGSCTTAQLWGRVQPSLAGYLGAVDHLLEVERALIDDPASRSVPSGPVLHVIAPCFRLCPESSKQPRQIVSSTVTMSKIDHNQSLFLCCYPNVQ